LRGRGNSQLKYDYDKEGKVIDYYKNLIDLWKDADPGIAEVEDAKKKLAGLKAQWNEAFGFGIRRL